MNQAISALSRLAFTLAILAVVVLLNRPAQGDQASANTVRCELSPPPDVAGLEACLVQLPLDVELHLELAAAYQAAGRHTDAHAHYARAVAIDPHDADARKRLEAAESSPR